MATICVRRSESVVAGTVIEGVAGGGGVLTEDGVALATLDGVAGAPDAVDRWPSAARKSLACVGAEIVRIARMRSGAAVAPYTSRLASSSGLSTPPERLIPAKSP